MLTVGGRGGKQIMALPNKGGGGGFRPGGGGFNRGTFAPRREAEHRINHHIRVPQVRLVGDNVTVGVYSTQDAMRIAQEQGLDLVEISPQADPPVCKVIDYNKFLYDKKKKEKEMKAKAKTTEMKEIRFTPNTDDHDFDFKSKHGRESDRAQHAQAILGESLGRITNSPNDLRIHVIGLDS